MTDFFYKLPKAVASRTDLLASDKLIFAIIIDCMKGKKICWPGKRCLAKRSGLSGPAVCGCIRRLEGAGVLVVDRRGNGKSNVYTTGQQTLPVKEVNRSTDFTRGGKDSLPEAVNKLDRKKKELLKENEVFFLDFWKIFKQLSPSPVGSRKEAESAWRAATKKTTPAVIIQGLRRYADQQRRLAERENFRPNWKHCCRWLRAELWVVEPEPARSPAKPKRAAPENPEDDELARSIRMRAEREFLGKAKDL